MATNVRIIYKVEDQTIVGFLDSDIDRDEHLERCDDTLGITENIITWDDEELHYPHEVTVDESGVASKVEE